MTELDSNADIDDALYSRQRYVLGDKAMNRMKDSNVAIFSMKSLGVEIAKNVVLAGIKTLTIHDHGEVEAQDLSGQFFVKDKDIGSNRATVTAASLQELNPYVRVSVHSDNDTPLTALPLSAFDGYQCVVIADWAPHATLVAIDQHVRQQGNRFIWAWSRGLFAGMFTDFGDQFEIYDVNGEAAVTRLVNRIEKKANPEPDTPPQLVIVCIRPHNLSTGDWIAISEVTGLEGLNGQERQVLDTINAHTFVIAQGEGVSGDFRWGGVVTQVKKSVVRSYTPLQEQLLQPTISETSDFGKYCHPYALVALTRALDSFHTQHGRLPQVRVAQDVAQMQAAVTQVFIESPELEASYRNCFYSPEQQSIPAQQVDATLLHAFTYTIAYTLPAISAYHGGVVGQEVLKAVSGKFSPYNQWCFYDCVEMFEKDRPAEDYTIQPEDSARDAPLIAILGRETTQLLASLRVFLIGAGAIGCEMLKNLAMHSVATSSRTAGTEGSAVGEEGGGEGKKGKVSAHEGGAVIVTDPDVIEKSNLNRQFLFRASDIQKHKSEAACAAAVSMHPDMCTDARLDRVGPDSEGTYTDKFYSNLDVCINALDNVQARLYVDQRCVVAQRPLIDSGTLGTKGHTQVVVPHVTESYGSTRDPAEEQVPFCTLRSFPHNINHTIQWARDRFEKLYNLKPLEANVYLQQQDPIVSLSYNESEALSIASARRSLKQLQRLPRNFADVVVHARHKFDKLFNHAARNLLQAFPPDLKDANGIPFWSLPKRQPTPLTFDPEDPLHVNFVYHSACIWAAVYGVAIGTRDEAVEVSRATPEVPWVPKDKSDATVDPMADADDNETANDTAAAPQASINEISDQEVRDLIIQLNTALSLGDDAPAEAKSRPSELHPQQFEKDDDSNHHIDFISAAANLRARVYGITEVDRLQVKLVAGKITPAIATTTAAVSGLVTVELIKLVQAQLHLARKRASAAPSTSARPRLLADLTPSDQLSIELFRCAFINLAIPLQALSEPMPCPRTKVTDQVSVSLWDRWEIRKGKNMTVQEFIDAVASKYRIKATAVIQGSKMIWVSLFPAHKKRLDKKLRKQLDEVDTKYVDLTLSCTDADGNDIDNTPPVRFWLTSK
eukprot:TRINITY_DN4500_c0_g1_i3.p1 TRINITY_DN4500_c0_g1~~TRINITY_DN4500_c0_g1_i3.p1  ORF type:complete len:1158 (-),score=246.08 TRINITY_DN4500_c0_g1_i3:101-3457(-)